MSNISSIYVLDNKEIPIFTLERHRQGSNSLNKTLLSRFIYSLNSISSQIKTDEPRIIKIDNENYLILKDSIINFKYMIEYGNDATIDQISLVINKVKQKFIESFKGKLDLPVSMKIELISQLKEFIMNLI